MTFNDEVVQAICNYMNNDPMESNLTIVQGLTGDRSFTRAELIFFDGDGAVFRAFTLTEDRELRLPWPRKITTRPEVREQLFALLDQATNLFGN